MHRICIIAAAVIGFGAVVAAAEEPSGRPGAGQPATPTVPPASGALSSDLNRSGGGDHPTRRNRSGDQADPACYRLDNADIPPPGTPGGNPAVKPKQLVCALPLNSVRRS
jgi:hypothetical protein